MRYPNFSSAARRSRRQPQFHPFVPETRVAVLAALALFGALALVGYIHVLAATPQTGDGANLQALTADHTIFVSATYAFRPTLKALVKDSNLIVVGHVAGSGTTRLIPQPKGSPHPMIPTPQGSLPGDKAQLAATPPPSTPMPHAQGPLTDPGLPVTTFPISVTRVLRGSASGGAQLMVNQAGGSVTLPTYPGGPQLHRTLVFEDNLLMRNGDDVLLFLVHNPDGTYYILSGPQGRFAVSAGSAYAIATGIPVARDHDGESLDAFIAEIRAVQ